MKFNLLKLIFNIGKLEKLATVAGEYVSRIVKHQGSYSPTCEEMQSILQAASELIDAGIIDIPNIDEHALSIRIEEIKAQLQCDAKKVG